MMFPAIDAMLRSCPDAANQQRLRDNRKACANFRMHGEVAHADERANLQIAVLQHLNPSHVGKMVDVQ